MPGTERPDAAVIIPHYNDVVRLKRCLAVLAASDLQGVDIVVVDNGSSQSLEALKTTFPMVRFFIEPEKGAAAARNRGVRETTAPVLIFIDADCVAAPDWLDMARHVQPRGDLIGGRVDVFDETPPPRSGAEAFEAVFAFQTKSYIIDQGFCVTANLVTRREVFKNIGGFVNGVSEDRDWSMRAVAKGYSLIYENGLVVSHPARSDWPALRHKWHRLTRELCASNGFSRGDRLRWGLRGFAMPVSALAHLPKVLLSPKLASPSERLAAAATLMRLRFVRMGWMLRQALGLVI